MRVHAVLQGLRRRVAEGRSDAPDAVDDLLGRIGLVGYGVAQLLIATLALQVAMGVVGLYCLADAATRRA